tara:strand:+ start:157 stop:564 length:408 start_codon:yes stop_codon:yes gene_type:complete
MTCTEWTGAKDEAGYGLAWKEGACRRMHRWAYAEKHGPIPDGLHVLHRCDNPSCYNTDHLFLGTHRENMQDKKAKGRCSSMPGEKHPQAKLTWEKVRDIRAVEHYHGVNKALAKQFDVHHSSISLIRKGKIWADT